MTPLGPRRLLPQVRATEQSKHRYKYSFLFCSIIIKVIMCNITEKVVTDWDIMHKGRLWALAVEGLFICECETFDFFIYIQSNHLCDRPPFRYSTQLWRSKKITTWKKYTHVQRQSGGTGRRKRWKERVDRVKESGRREMKEKEKGQKERQRTKTWEWKGGCSDDWSPC